MGQTEMDGMPPKGTLLSLHAAKGLLDGGETLEGGQLVKFSGTGHVKHLGQDFIEGEEGVRPVGVLQVDDLKFTPVKKS